MSVVATIKAEAKSEDFAVQLKFPASQICKVRWRCLDFPRRQHQNWSEQQPSVTYEWDESAVVKMRI